MKVLIVHNYYKQPGGEDNVFAAEAKLLRQCGNDVVEYTDKNKRIDNMNPIYSAASTLWSKNSKRKISELIERTKPDIAHFHNTFLLISPSAYYACKEANVPVIQSLHNPRLLCPAASFYRSGAPCDDCLGKNPPWPGILHACYHNSRVQTAIVASMLTLHRWLKTWEKKVDTYIVFTEFYKRKFIEGGLPGDKIAIKPHFLDPDPGCRAHGPGDYALFVGRFDEVKGIYTLLNAWKHTKNIPLKIVGRGDLGGDIKNYLSKNPSIPIEIIGQLGKRKVFEFMKNARFLIWPSEGYYETFGLVAIEAFACGVPVIASRIGTLAENVKDGHTGLHFTPGDAEDLSAKVNWAWSNPDKMTQMGRTARKEYETRYTAEKNYKMLLDIYERALSKK
ncbi:MAG: glycosyltransferase family 4 protein [Deltaproteobacteria bacterium]